MRAYSAASEEARQTRELLKNWLDEGLLTQAQYQVMAQDTVCELRCTNVFLRLVLFFFTLVTVVAVIALFFVALPSPAQSQTTGIMLLVFAAVSYAAAELAVSGARLYRHGIEEALLVCSIGLLCAALQVLSTSTHSSPMTPGGPDFLVPAAGAVLSLWIWHRFGLHYAWVAAMIFVMWLPSFWTSSHSAQHLIVAAFYTAGLVILAIARRSFRLTYLNFQYSVAEALLWLGLYLSINLQLSSLNLNAHWWSHAWTNAAFPRLFYWATWVLTWCLPPIVLVRGLRLKDRPVIIVGAAVAILTLATNKPYLGWERHSWDPILLGASLISLALFIRHWLSKGSDGMRHGFTAKRLGRKDSQWINTGATALGFASPGHLTPAAQTPPSDVHYGGGDFGGGGAASDF